MAALLRGSSQYRVVGGFSLLFNRGGAVLCLFLETMDVIQHHPKGNAWSGVRGGPMEWSEKEPFNPVATRYVMLRNMEPMTP